MKTIYDIDPLFKTKHVHDILDEPIVIRVTKFDDAAAKDFSENIQKAYDINQKILPVVIDSYGGYVYSLMSMISDIKSCQIPVATICVSKAMSCGSILLTCGTPGMRYIDPQATVMIHDIASGDHGKVEEIKANAAQIDKLQKQVFKIMAENCGHPADYFLKIIHDKSHAEWYLDPKEAKKHKIVDHIKIPNFKVKATVIVEVE